MTALDAHLGLRAMIDEFARCGMQDACTSPGSRNTPLLVSFAAEQRLRVWSHIDERASGFFAVGAARASGRPVAVTCTSGTAAANFLPAVIEAHEGGVPLIVLSADRPPELRDVGAGQTIDQTKLYGDAVKWFFDIGVPEQSTPERMRWLRSLACRAYWTALDGRPGVVHLNVPLREPLALTQPLPPDEPGGGGRRDGRPWVSQSRQLRGGGASSRHPFGIKTVFVAGELGTEPGMGRLLAEFAARAGVPLLADPRSGARTGPASIAHYDLILRDPETAAKLSPACLCRIGDLPTSKPLRAWIAGLNDAEHVSFSSDERWSDPAARIGYRSIGQLSETLRRLVDDDVEPAPPQWLAEWRAADSAVEAAIADSLSNSGLSEPVIAATLGAMMPPQASLFVAASMPIRDIEEFLPTLEQPPRVLANRGANGIDGTVSAAFGAAASGSPVVLLIGDVALAHDIGGLMAALRTGLRITIVLLNNGGGGIFDFLPIADSADQAVFETQLATPTQLDFERVAAVFGCRYALVSEVGEFRAAVEQSMAADTTTLIEIRGERPVNRRLHRELEAAALTALRQR